MRFALCVLTCAAAIFAGIDQSSSSTDFPAARASVASPTFSDPYQYNSYDFCNSPLGLFERESSRVQVSVGYRSLQLQGTGANDSLRQSSTAWNMPALLIGKPNIFYMLLNYTPATITEKTLSGAKRTLPLTRFGLTLAAQVASGIFQIGLRTNGFLGDEALEGSQNSRVIMGLEALSLTLGSRIHEMVAIGLMGGATVKLDSLHNLETTPYPRPDRYVAGQIPLLGWYVDFGKEGFPIAGDFSMNIATSRFIGVDDTGVNRNMDPIKGDSLAWQWQTIGNFRAADFTIRPSLFLGYWRNQYQDYSPTVANNSLSVGLTRKDRNWKISDFNFGLGASAKLTQYATTWIEFGHSAMGLGVGDSLPDSCNKNQGYNRFIVGIEANIHALDFLHFPSSIETFARIGYFSMSDNGGIHAFRSEDFGLLTAVAPYSQTYRSQPNFGWGAIERISGLTFGLGGTFFDKRLRADVHLALLSRSLVQQYNGSELGIDCTYNLR
jgi:hypothetical protein